MNAKAYLSQLKMIEIKITDLETEAEMLRASVFDIGSALSNDVKVSKSSSGEASYTGKIEKIADIEKQIELEKHNLLIKRNEIVNTIHSLNNPNYVAVLFKHYVEYKSLKQISKEMHYDYGYVRKLHGAALQGIYKILITT